MNETDYVNPSRLEQLMYEIAIDLQENAWVGWRDPEFCAKKCPDMAPLPGSKELLAMAAIGKALDIEGRLLLERLPRWHRKFPARSSVRKTVLIDFMDRLEAHLERGRQLRVLVREPGAPYDSIKGWCEHQRKHGVL